MVDKGIGDFVDNGIPTAVDLIDMEEMESEAGVVDIEGLESWLTDAGEVITSVNNKSN